MSGCARKPPVPATVAVAVTELDALVTPPSGWTAVPMKRARNHWHQTWLSPTGDTAYGVIRFSMPLPFGDSLALRGFLSEMKRSEGEARLIEKRLDGEKGVLRFEAEGGLYHIRGIIVTRGFGGWAVYAGTLRARPIRLDELEQAVQARENTHLGIEKPNRAQADHEGISDD
jgi:hypothetical protein